MNEDSSTRSWEAAAEAWIEHADSSVYQSAFLRPRMLALAGDVSGRRVLDLGCGEGAYARELARRGARVTGVDGSQRLIDAARRRNTAVELDADYHCLNANALTGLADGAFDLVIASMVLMNVEDYPGTMREAHRVLAAGGALCFSITHPCFSAPVSDWVGGKGRRAQHFAVDRYFERIAWEERIAPTFRTPTLRRHRPLEDYMAGALAAGFELREFLEPMASDEEVRAVPKFVYMARVPYFLFMRWEKAARKRT